MNSVKYTTSAFLQLILSWVKWFKYHVFKYRDIKERPLIEVYRKLPLTGLEAPVQNPESTSDYFLSSRALQRYSTILVLGLTHPSKYSVYCNICRY